MHFNILAREGKARAGVLSVNGKVLETPGFVFAATYGYINLVDPLLFSSLGICSTMVNTFQMAQHSKTSDLRKHLGSSLVMTDSGGFQVMSYGDCRVQGTGKIAFPGKYHMADPDKRSAFIDEDGVTFIEDKHQFRLTPAKSMQLQSQLGSDCIFSFDQCHTQKNYEE